jgi:hypothetical protein
LEKVYMNDKSCLGDYSSVISVALVVTGAEIPGPYAKHKVISLALGAEKKRAVACSL